MKFNKSLLFSLGALAFGQAVAQEEDDTCPAGYTPVISFITVTQTPEPTSTIASDECPSGYTQVVSYITVTATPEVSTTAEVIATSTTEACPEESSPVVIWETVTSSITVTAETSTSSAPSTSSATTAEEPTTTIYLTSTTTSTVTVDESTVTAAATTYEPATTSTVSISALEAVKKAVAADTSSSSEVSSATSSAASSSSASSTSSAIGSVKSGEATYYGGNVSGGTCSFSTYTLPSGIYGTALSDSNWENSANCGACISVTGPSGNSITAMIVDQCSGCGTNHLDLFSDAFSALADQSLGVIDVTWQIVQCPITTPLELHNKEGVSAYWFSMQVVNANEPVASLEVSTDGGSTWTSATRQTYNFFEISSGTGTTTVDVRVTSSTGSVVTVEDVTISSGASTTASENFV
ncbi:putative extracellular cellulase allergen asp f7 [Phaeomoniella chlamydospora]|uniref:Putative extracellular cellulase allergen asp f7 n=1 Tax=Phaeomoniella chlamydospora TaxID=158046 RepID=A0A0G2EH31_PHACM|nr:putative extracellular cellulase allergen asp f7 [Phaeomoniella chlamydospora]